MVRGRLRRSERYIEVRRCSNGHDYVYRMYEDGSEENVRCPICLSDEFTVKYVKRKADDGLYVIEEVGR